MERLSSDSKNLSQAIRFTFACSDLGFHRQMLFARSSISLHPTSVRLSPCSLSSEVLSRTLRVRLLDRLSPLSIYTILFEIMIQTFAIECRQTIMIIHRPSGEIILHSKISLEYWAIITASETRITLNVDAIIACTIKYVYHKVSDDELLAVSKY
jgi:hypothetical protein